MSNAATEQVVIESANMTMIIPDIKKPTWYGDYHHGKLAIYLVEVVKGAPPDSITLVSIYTNELGSDFVVSASYEDTMELEEIVAHLQANIIISYQRAQFKSEPANYVPGPTTSQ